MLNVLWRQCTRGLLPQSRHSHLILHAGQMRGAIALLHSVVDHPAVWRQYKRANAVDRLWGDAALDDFQERLGRGHGLTRCAPGLERGFGQRRLLAEAVCKRFDLRTDAKNLREKIIGQQIKIGSKTLLRRARGREPLRSGFPDRKPRMRSRLR